MLDVKVILYTFNLYFVVHQEFKLQDVTYHLFNVN